MIKACDLCPEMAKLREVCSGYSEGVWVIGDDVAIVM